MPFDVLEQKFHALPEQSFQEVSNFFDYIIFKFSNKAEKTQEDAVDDALVEKINAACKAVPQERIAQGAVLSSMWGAIKNDTW